MAKHTYYFTHDFNSHTDEKILDLRMDLGFEGYGIYWFLIETLASSSEYKLETNYKRLGFSSSIKEDALKQVVEKYNLFKVEGDFFWSESLNQRMNKLDDFKRKQAENGRKGGVAKALLKQKSSDAKANPSDPLANSSIVEYSKGKESKEKDLKENESIKEPKPIEDKTKPKPPKDLDEVLDYCYLTLKNYKFDAWGFYEWYESVHWYTNKSNPVRNWKNKLTTAINSNAKGLSDLRLSRNKQAQEYVYRVGELDKANVKLKGRANELMRGLKNAIR